MALIWETHVAASEARTVGNVETRAPETSMNAQQAMRTKETRRQRRQIPLELPLCHQDSSYARYGVIDPKRGTGQHGGWDVARVRCPVTRH